MKQIATTQDYRIAAVFVLGSSQPVGRDVVEQKLCTFAGLSVEKARQLAGHWFGTQAFKAVRS